MPAAQAASISSSAWSSVSPWPKNSGAEPTPPKLPQPSALRATVSPGIAPPVSASPGSLPQPVPSTTPRRTSVGGWPSSGCCSSAVPGLSARRARGWRWSTASMTHHEDFARAFVPLLAHPRTLGEAIQITSDDVLTWDQIAQTLAAALGVSARAVHVPSDAIAAADPDWGAGLLGDKAHSMIFDNAKVRGLVPGWRAVIPFEAGAREIADWYRADPARQVTDARLDAVMDKLAAAWSQR